RCPVRGHAGSPLERRRPARRRAGSSCDLCYSLAPMRPAATTFGKYRLIRALGQGGMAEVYLAKQIGLQGFEKAVVVKRILPLHSKNPEFVAMFLDEARLSARLAHPNLVQVFDFGLEDGCYYLAMEYLAGEDLRSIVRAAKKKREHVP